MIIILLFAGVSCCCLCNNTYIISYHININMNMKITNNINININNCQYRYIPSCLKTSYFHQSRKSHIKWIHHDTFPLYSRSISHVGTMTCTQWGDRDFSSTASGASSILAQSDHRKAYGV